MPTSCTSCWLGNCFRKPEICPCSSPTIATLIGCWANTVPPPKPATTAKKKTNTRTASRISPPKFLCLCGRFAGSAYPGTVLLFEIDPLGLGTKIAAPIKDVNQCSRLRNIEIDLAEVSDAQVIAISRPHGRGGGHRGLRGTELRGILGPHQHVGPVQLETSR